MDRRSNRASLLRARHARLGPPRRLASASSVDRKGRRCAMTTEHGAGTARARPVALYARVSTADQTPDNQLLALRAYAEARGWAPTEYVDVASGARDRRPRLDALVAAARSRKVGAVIVVKLDRLARSVRHLVTL